jgi:hypothetical protein
VFGLLREYSVARVCLRRRGSSPPGRTQSLFLRGVRSMGDEPKAVPQRPDRRPVGRPPALGPAGPTRRPPPQARHAGGPRCPVLPRPGGVHVAGTPARLPHQPLPTRGPPPQEDGPRESPSNVLGLECRRNLSIARLIPFGYATGEPADHVLSSTRSAGATPPRGSRHPPPVRPGV